MYPALQGLRSGFVFLSPAVDIAFAQPHCAGNASALQPYSWFTAACANGFLKAQPYNLL